MFVFFDLVMAGLEVCRVQDIALSVLATVIGHQRDKGWTLLDAGWMAMSRDRGTAEAARWTRVMAWCATWTAGRWRISSWSAPTRSMGSWRAGPASRGEPMHLPVGTQVRILPNHACSTAAQYGHYNVIGPGREIKDSWPRFSGW